MLLEQGCEEANPTMAYLLTQSNAAFLIGKYVLTAIFLPVALVMESAPLSFGGRFAPGGTSLTGCPAALLVADRLSDVPVEPAEIAY